MAVVQAVMDADLAALKVRVAERRRDIDDRAGLVARGLARVYKALQMGEREREERGLLRADQHRAVTVNIAARIEGHQDQLLRLEPFHGLVAQVGKGIAVNILKARLVRRLVVGNAHAVRVAAAHIIFHVVDRRAVFAADDVRLLHGALALYVENNVEFVGLVRAEDHFIELSLAGRNRNAFAVLDDVGQLVGKGEFCK